MLWLHITCSHWLYWWTGWVPCHHKGFCRVHHSKSDERDASMEVNQWRWPHPQIFDPRFFLHPTWRSLPFESTTLDANSQSEGPEANLWNRRMDRCQKMCPLLGPKMVQKAIYLDTCQSNVTTMWLTPGYHAFKAFCAEAGLDDIFGYDFIPLIAKAAEISDNDESIVDPNDDLDSQEGWSSEKLQSTNHDVWHTEKPRMFNLVGKTSSPPNTIVIVDEEDKTGNRTLTMELLLYHYRFRHISFIKLQLMGYSQSGWQHATSQCVWHACMPRPQKGPGEQEPKTLNIQIRTLPPRRHHFSGPNGITSPQLGSPNDRIFNQAALPLHAGFHWSGHMAGIRIPTEIGNS